MKLIVAGLVLLGALPVTAQPPPEETTSGSMMFVLDASGSMTAPLTTGGTRMDAAKQAMNTLIDGLPVNLHVGLETYGTGTGNSAAEKAAGCQDVQVLTPVGPVDKDAMRARVAGITPRGYTPIGESLRQAAAALPASGPRAIVLVSDGIDTCAPPEPCEVARSLAGAGVELAVHTVGFQVDPAAREQLECIASATGGEYNDAPDASALDELLPKIADRALRFYDVVGESASGATSPADAPYLEPGQYTDTVDKKEPRYYRVHVPAGATGHFTAVHVVEKDAERIDSGVRLRLVDAARRECASSRGFREYNYDGPETASVSWTPTPSSRCDPSAAHYLEVRWDNKRSEPSDEVELVVAVEPGVSGPRGTPSAPVSYPPPPKRQDIVWGGGSFNEAAALPGTDRYLDRVNYSEYSIYKVWLDWGQALSYQVTALAGAPGGATVVTELRGPTREATRAWRQSARYAGHDLKLDPIATPRVTYANRDGRDGVRQAAQAGWYFLVVKLSPVWTDGASAPSEGPTFEIAVSVTGARADGPRYEKLSMPSGTPPVPTSSADWHPALAARPDRDFSWWLVGGIAGVLLLGGASLLLMRGVRSGRP